MAEYIEREKLLRDINHYHLSDGMFQHWVEVQQAADVAPVAHGWWETNSDRPDSLICSVCKCGFDMWKHDPHNYCPNCGAKMYGERKD